jgi:hypothetical protein
MGTSDDDNVTPFRPRRPPAAETALHSRTRRAQPEARRLAAEQSAPDKAAYAGALIQQANQQFVRTGKIVPARITIALDLRGLEGPEVDIACGAQEPAVDLWELGLEVPTREQLAKLAKLTGFDVAYFYQPIPPGPLTDSLFICYGGRRGCELTAPDVIDENGVLLYEGKPRPMPPDVQQALF